eukprot:TRINITY_DN4432_c0_g1_i7.p2 TRINITY_DN4432_c0_g1~~TRINITY_DN4432_c0_g1_i7.p2  ORF type:complete len:127 (+),score=3.28 TRINITY_DN4432_c0_g1_i7:60-440(+)
MAGRCSLIILTVFFAFAPTINVVSYRKRTAFQVQDETLRSATVDIDPNRGDQKLAEVRTSSDLSQGTSKPPDSSCKQLPVCLFKPMCLGCVLHGRKVFSDNIKRPLRVRPNDQRGFLPQANGLPSA